MAKIGLDMHVVDGIYQGSRSHVLELFSRVVALCPEITFVFMLDDPQALLKYSSGFNRPNVELVRMPSANPLRRLVWQLPLAQLRHGFDFLHTQYISPFPSFCRTLITLHDVLFESHSQYFGKIFVLRSKLLMRLSALLASHIITVSEYSKAEICSRYKLPGHKVSVIYNGVNRSRYFPGDDGRDTIIHRGFKPNTYILSVGRLEPRKNHLALIQAYKQLNSDLPLVIIGQRDFNFQAIYLAIAEFGLEDKVFILEGIDDEELASFYRHAFIFSYPSWAEGFGMPVIEAMASGVPVVTSDRTSLAEIAKDAAILVDPADVDALARSIQQLMLDEVQREELIEAGLKRAQLFDWDVSAEIIAQVYRDLLLIR